MPTFVYMTRCDGCGNCVDICPSDIFINMHNVRWTDVNAVSAAITTRHVNKSWHIIFSLSLSC